MSAVGPPSPAMAGNPRSGGIREFVVVGAWLGLAYGFAEAVESCLLSLYPGALSWRSGNSPRVLWVAPIVYASSATLRALFCYGLSRAIRRWDWV